MAYLDAHNAKLRLAEDLLNPKYETYLQGMLESQNEHRRKTPTKRGIIGDGWLDGQVSTTNIEVLQATLRSAETFTMSLPMHQLIMGTTADMPDTPILPEEVPSQTGVLWTPQPFEQYDLHGRLLLSHLVVWRTTSRGVILDWFTDRDDPRDEINKLLRGGEYDYMLRVGKYMLAQSMTIDFYKPVPPQPDCSSLRELGRYLDHPIPGSAATWRSQYQVYEEEFIDDEGNAQIEFVPVLTENAILDEEQFALIQDAYRGLGTDPARRLDNYPTKQLVCFWRMCQQTLAAREYAHPDRHLAKRMVKRQFATSPVTVITLRRRATKQREEGRIVEWDHRWLRRGHWRRQWCGSGETRHQEPRYINPTICGPEDKPLLIRPHVNLLAR